jgi:hypothetical protein
MPTRPRVDRPELWGPLTTAALLARLRAEYSWACSEAARSGRHPSPAALIAWEGLRPQYGGPLNPARLPFHARAITREIQTRTWHA